MREPNPIIMAVSFHLKYELTDVAEAKAAMPTRI
jgi:hypothetical protein